MASAAGPSKVSAHHCNPSRVRTSRAETPHTGFIVLYGAGEDVSGSSSDAIFGVRAASRRYRPDGRAGDYTEAGGRHASELGDHLLGKSAAQICLGRVSVQVVERQNGDERGVTRRAEGEPASGEQHPRTGEQGEEPQTRNGGLRHGYRRGRGCGGRRGGRLGRDGAFLDARVQGETGTHVPRPSE